MKESLRALFVMLPLLVLFSMRDDSTGEEAIRETLAPLPFNLENLSA